MLTASVTVQHTPAYSKVVAYMDGSAYPRSGANTFVQQDACGGAIDFCNVELKIFTLTPGVQHTLDLVLTTAEGDPLGIKMRSFSVGYSGGCGAGDGLDCNGHGICHDGYCVCFDDFYGSDCSNSIADKSADLMGSLSSDFAAGQAYRLRRDALNLEKLASARFVSQVHLEQTAAELAQSKAAMGQKTAEIREELSGKIFRVDDPTTEYNENSDLQQALVSNAVGIASTRASVFDQQERNTIVIQQALQEAARLKTKNHEAYLDHKRSLFEHQTAVQNRHDEDRLGVATLKASQQQKIDDAFTEGRFIKSRLRQANGPRKKVSDLKIEDCTSNQFFGTPCSEVDYDDAQFAAGASTWQQREEAGTIDESIALNNCGTISTDGHTCLDSVLSTVPR